MRLRAGKAQKENLVVGRWIRLLRSLAGRFSGHVVGCFLLCVGLAAQDLQKTSGPLPEAPVPASISVGDSVVTHAKPSIPPQGPRRITLEEAQAQAQTAVSPMAHLAQLQVEAARQARLAAQSDYFPKVSSTFLNLHFNKFMGDQFDVHRPLLGESTTFAIPLLGQNLTFVAVTAAQPITPLFKIHELVNIMRADERIAMAKAGMPVAETAHNVEKNYYGLLVAQRQLAIAKADDERIRGRQLLASSSALPGPLPSHNEEQLGTDKALVIAASNVKELSGTLNLLLGYPVDTELELVPPDPQYEDISLTEASDKAMVANPEVIEAEQTVVKARSASKLSKLDYIPDLAVVGGYAYQNNLLPVLPLDFSFVGMMGSYTLFDFGKREHTVKERTAQVSAAELAVELTKAKVAASVKSSYFAMQRARQLSELAHRMASAVQLQATSYAPENDEVILTKAKLEVEVFQADLEYRQALAALKELMRER
jgi:outer membrane protein TolC